MNGTTIIKAFNILVSKTMTLSNSKNTIHDVFYVKWLPMSLCDVVAILPPFVFFFSFSITCVLSFNVIFIILVL